MLDFEAYGRPLVAVSEFKYLARVLKDSDDNWPVVVGNLRKARKRWERMLGILGCEGEYPRTYGNFYKAVVQATLLFGAESWAISPRIGGNLGGFHHRVSRCLKNIQPKKTGEGTWIYLPHHSADTGSMSGGVAKAGGTGVDYMVVAGRNQPRSGIDRDRDRDRGGGGRVGRRHGGGGEDMIGRVGENQDGN